MAESPLSYTAMAGRFPFQEAEEKRILFDLIGKLSISSEDSCLEVGCGAGNLLIPLSFFVKSIVGVDHGSCLCKLKERFPGAAPGIGNVQLIAGDFLDLTLDGKFDKIIVYSVLHYLADGDEVMKFVNKTMSMLAPGGKLLLGDLPNKSKKERFLKSEYGKTFVAQWNERVGADGGMTVNHLDKDGSLVEFDDTLVLEILSKARKAGLNAYVLPQPDGLVFNHTREDILIVSTGSFSCTS